MRKRIAAGGIVIDAERILLVRYVADAGGGYLVGPGGEVEGKESLVDTVRRTAVYAVSRCREHCGGTLVRALGARGHDLDKIPALCSIDIPLESPRTS